LDMTDEWFMGVTLQFPLFDGGRRLAAARATRASAEAARHRLEAATQEQQANLNTALDQWRVNGERRARLADAVQEKATSVSTFRQLHQEGRLSLSELLTQETELLVLALDERRMAHAQRTAFLQYHAILGTMNPELVTSLVGGSS